jgi:hypothetical protein
MVAASPDAAEPVYWEQPACSGSRRTAQDAARLAPRVPKEPTALKMEKTEKMEMKALRTQAASLEREAAAMARRESARAAVGADRK